jgi:hypothetical protein
MARIPMDDFEEGEEIVRVYLAAALDEARRVEAALGAAGVAFGVEVETFATRGLLAGGTSRRGAGFWVAAGEADGAIDVLERAGLVRGLVVRDGG